MLENGMENYLIKNVISQTCRMNDYRFIYIYKNNNKSTKNVFVFITEKLK